MNITVNTEFSPWVLRKPPSPPPPVVEEDNVIIMKKFYISLGEVKVWVYLHDLALQKTSHFRGRNFICTTWTGEMTSSTFKADLAKLFVGLCWLLCSVLFHLKCNWYYFPRVYRGTNARLKNMLGVTWKARKDTLNYIHGFIVHF